MDWHTAFNLAFAGLSGVMGFIIKVLWDAIVTLRRDLGELERSIKDNYVRRDDFRDTMRAMFEKLDRIEIKIDGKMDKHA